MQEHHHRLKILVNLPDIKSYQDTYYMFLQMLPHIEMLYIITTEGQDLSFYQNNMRTTQFIEISRHQYARKASRYLTQHINPLSLDVIHDMFGHFAAFCQQQFYKKRRYIMLTTLRTTNFGWFQRVKPLGFNINFHYAAQRVLSLWRDRRIIKHVDHVVVLGPGHELDVIQGHHIDADQISFIPSETDTYQFMINSEEEDSLNRGQIYLPRRNKHCIYTGALTRNKGIHILLDAFTKVYEYDPEVTLQLIGRCTPFEKHWFLDTLNRHPLKDKITFTPALPRTQLIPLYQSAQLYLFPSLFEGSPRSLREAIACACVAVASDIPGCRGVDPQGDFIHFTPMNHLQAWIKTWIKALQESPQQYQQRQIRGVHHLQQYHSIKAVAQSYLELYQKLIEKREIQN